MMWTGSVHPPGAAAIMGCMDQAAFQQLGYWYVLYPVLFGSLFVLFMGHLTHKLKHRYEFMVGGLFGDGWVKLRRAEEDDRNNERLEQALNECENCTPPYFAILAEELFFSAIPTRSFTLSSLALSLSSINPMLLVSTSS